MPVILNEVKQVEYIIEKGEVGNKPTSTLFLLGKYYRQKKDLDKEQTFHKLNEFMQQHYKNYNSALWEDIIENIAKKANKYSLREINSIDITQSELNEIAKIDNLKYQKLLFTMLCYAKLYNLISENNHNWINTDIKEVFRVARVTVKYRNDKFIYLNDLEKSGLISFSNKNDNLNIQVNFTDMSDGYVLRIDDFRELGYEYLNYVKKDKFIRCAECKRLVKKKNKYDYSKKYCAECSKKIESHNALARKRKQRNMENVTKA